METISEQPTMALPTTTSAALVGSRTEEKDSQQQQQQRQPLFMLQQPFTPLTNTYERSVDALQECFSMVSVDLDEEDRQATATCLGGGAGGGDCYRLSGDDDVGDNVGNALSQLQRQVRALQSQLRRSDEENDQLRRERAANRRELSNLRRSIKSNVLAREYELRLAELRSQVDFWQVERDYFIREVRVLEDKVDELGKINDAKDCQLQVYDKLFRQMQQQQTADRDENTTSNVNANANDEIPRNSKQSICCCSNDGGEDDGPPGMITLSVGSTSTSSSEEERSRCDSCSHDNNVNDDDDLLSPSSHRHHNHG